MLFIRANSHRRYLPGVKLPNNINAIPDIETVAKDADILIFNFPHQVRSLIALLTGSLLLKSALNLKDMSIHELGGFLVLKESMSVPTQSPCFPLTYLITLAFIVELYQEPILPEK